MFVRLLMPYDVPEIVELSRMNCDISTPHLEFSPEKVEETCAAAIATASPTMFVVEENREVIALLVATINEYRHASGIFTTQEVLFVRPDRQGSRAAVLLTKELIRWSEMLGAIEITGGNDNDFKSERTARFLAHFGFEQVGFFMRRKMNNG